MKGSVESEILFFKKGERSIVEVGAGYIEGFESTEIWTFEYGFDNVASKNSSKFFLLSLFSEVDGLYFGQGMRKYFDE